MDRRGRVRHNIKERNKRVKRGKIKMVGEKLNNKHLKEMKKNLLVLWESVEEKKKRRYVAIIDSINLQIAFLDQELQIAKGVEQLKSKAKETRIVSLN